MDLIDIGGQVRSARKGRGLSQSKLAELSGVSRARLDALENGRASDIGFKNVVRILNAVGLDIRVGPANARRPTLDDLLQEEEDQARAPRMGR